MALSRPCSATMGAELPKQNTLFCGQGRIPPSQPKYEVHLRIAVWTFYFGLCGLGIRTGLPVAVPAPCPRKAKGLWGRLSRTICPVDEANPSTLARNDISILESLHPNQLDCTVASGMSKQTQSLYTVCYCLVDSVSFHVQDLKIITHSINTSIVPITR